MGGWLKFGKSRQASTSFELQGISSDRQTALWSTVLGVVLVVRGSMFLLNPQLATLECDRLQAGGMCKLLISSVRGEKVIPLPLDNLEQALVQKHGKSSQLVLLTHHQKLQFPINNGFSSTENKADQVNAFLQDPAATSLTIKQDNRWLAYPLGLSLTLLGSLSLALHSKKLL